MKLSKSARVIAYASAGLGTALLALWWLADHRRGMAWAMSAVASKFPDVPQITASQLAEMLGAPEGRAPLLIDARSADEFAVSHMAGARRIDPAATDAQLQALPRDRAVVCYCAAGYRGSALARRLRVLGFTDVANLSGGIFQWANEGGEVQRDGKPARAVHPFSRVFARLLHPRIRGPA